MRQYIHPKQQYREHPMCSNLPVCWPAPSHPQPLICIPPPLRPRTSVRRWTQGPPSPPSPPQAQDIRQKRQKVDEAIRNMVDRKAAKAAGGGSGGGGERGGALALSVADFASEGLRLRTEMQRAVEEERWGGARGGAPRCSRRWRRRGESRSDTQIRCTLSVSPG